MNVINTKGIESGHDANKLLLKMIKKQQIKKIVLVIQTGQKIETNWTTVTVDKLYKIW